MKKFTVIIIIPQILWLLQQIIRLFYIFLKIYDLLNSYFLWYTYYDKLYP